MGSHAVREEFFSGLRAMEEYRSGHEGNQTEGCVVVTAVVAAHLDCESHLDYAGYLAEPWARTTTSARVRRALR